MNPASLSSIMDYAPLNMRPGICSMMRKGLPATAMTCVEKSCGSGCMPTAVMKFLPGNLFPPGTPKTRPEIYVMGDRNPYRISVDQKNSTLYWGEVGPDAPNDSFATRGPRGYDEINQARKAGYYGWPFFVGNNYPYRRYNYLTGISGYAFDPAKPENTFSQ